MFNYLRYIKDSTQGKNIDRDGQRKKRSPKWRRVRNEFIKRNPFCKGCGSTKNLECHHIIPFHVDPDLELVESNLMTLCERGKYGMKCHQLLGHRGNYRKINEDVEIDADYWRKKVRSE